MGIHPENQVEAEFADTPQGKKLLSELSRQAGLSISQDSIHRQLPVGLFQSKKSLATSVFTGKNLPLTSGPYLEISWSSTN